MSDKNEAIPDTRVRKLRKDGSWIRRQDDSPTSKPEDLETKPLVKRNSYVLMAIKRYESLDSSSVSPPPETDTNPSDRDSTNQNGEKAKFLHDGVQPDGSSGQTLSDTKSKEPTKHLVTPPGENIKTGTVKTSPSVDAAPLPDPISSAKITSKELATSKVQPVNDTAVEKSITSTPEKVKDFKVVQKTEIAKPVPSADTDNQTAFSEHDPKRSIKNTTDAKLKSSPDVPAVTVATVTDKTSLSNTKQPAAGDQSEAPTVKANVKTAESQEDPASPPEPSTVITTVSTPEEKTTQPNSDQPLSQDLSKTPTDKATLTSGGSEEKPVALTKLVSTVKAKNEVPLADGGPVEPSVVSTPEQVSECLSKKLVKVEPSSNIDTQTASEQDANKTATEVEIETSPEVPPSNKSTLTVETTLSKREPAPSGLSEAPAAIADVKSAESQEDSVKTLDSTADLNTNTIIKPEPPTDTNTSPLKQQLEKVTAEIVEEVELESIPDILAPNKETLGNDTSNTETPSDSLPKSPPAETLVKTAERGEDSAAPPEAVLATCAERDVQSLDGDAPVKQSEQATSEHGTKQMPAIKTDEDVQTVPVAGNKDLVHKVIELTDALDVEAPGLESVSKPVDVPEPHLPQDSRLKQPQADNKNSEDLGKIADDLSSTKNHDRLFSNNDICTYCNKIIDGNAKIVFNEPSVICHPKCLKCGVCAKDLGGLEIPMFLADEAILCLDCYRKA